MVHQAVGRFDRADPSEATDTHARRRYVYTTAANSASISSLSHIDVVEIDPKLVEVAREHFYYRDPSNVTLTFTDARTYVNQTKQRYDIVVVDVYGTTRIFRLLL
ncbi:spermidine synthase [Candidatus Mycosynbacter amalyticus]|uniref:spermidine synthase n=1 Tax=Candidatus Mycosynbacter amalyticus TaxID=2665156 RepID=UPI0021B4AF47|nr:hypothetical protein [Candidatus Mycosynbacter amalyticus]